MGIPTARRAVEDEVREITGRRKTRPCRNLDVIAGTLTFILYERATEEGQSPVANIIKALLWLLH